MPDMKLYTIYYDDRTRAQVTPPFLPLDNSDGPAEWFEFHPILRFIEENTLQPDCWYGFFSPKFPAKADSSVDEMTMILDANPDAEVALFSPFWHELVTFRNVWLQGEHFHPGLIACTEAFLLARGERADLRAEIGDFTCSVFSNYIVARPRFWLAWRDLARAYLDHLQNTADPLPDLAPAAHEGPAQYQMKVFVQERLACWLLAHGDFRVVHAPYHRKPIALIPDDDPATALRALLRAADTMKRLARRQRLPGALAGWRLLAWLAERVRNRKLKRLARRAAGTLP